MSFYFVLKLGLGFFVLIIVALVRYQVVYVYGGMQSFSDDLEIGSLYWDAMTAAFIFVFWLIVGPSEQRVEKSEQIETSYDPTAATSTVTASGDDDDAGDVGGGDGD